MLSSCTQKFKQSEHFQYKSPHHFGYSGSSALIPCTSAPKKLLMTSLKPRPYSNERIAFFYWWNLPPNYCNIAISSTLRHSLLEREEYTKSKEVQETYGTQEAHEKYKTHKPHLNIIQR